MKNEKIFCLKKKKKCVSMSRQETVKGTEFRPENKTDFLVKAVATVYYLEILTIKIKTAEFLQK